MRGQQVHNDINNDIDSDQEKETSKFASRQRQSYDVMTEPEEL